MNSHFLRSRFLIIAAAVAALATPAAAQRLSLQDLDERLVQVEKGPSPRDLALGKWYLARHGVSIAGLASPEAMVCDGTYLWVANSSELLKVNVLDGTEVARIDTTTAIVSGPVTGLEHDGMDLWMKKGNYVAWIDGDGSVLDKRQVSPSGAGTTYDGYNVWLGQNSDLVAFNTMGIAGSIGDPLGKVSGRVYLGGAPTSSVYDGTSLWIAQAGQARLTRYTLDYINSQDEQRAFTLPGVPREMTFDGEHIWASLPATGQVTKIRASDGVVLGTYNIGGSVADLVYDGANVWATNGTYLWRIDPTDGSKELHVAGPSPRLMTFDGTHLWVADDADGSLRKF